MRRPEASLRVAVIEWLGDGKRDSSDEVGVALELKEKTRGNYRADLLHYDKWLGKGEPGLGTLEDLNLTRISKYLAPYVQKGDKRSAYNKVTAFHSLSRYLHENRIWWNKDENTEAIVGLRGPKPNKRPRPQYTDAQVRKILEIAGEGRMGVRDTAIVAGMLASGSRSKELRTLPLKDLHLDKDGGWLYISKSKTDEGEQRITAFGNEARVAFLRYVNNERPEWKPVAGHEEPLFLKEDGAVFSEAGWNSVRERISIRVHSQMPDVDFTFHRLRAKWAEMQSRNAVPMHLLMGAGGWANAEQALRYIGRARQEDLLALKKVNGLDTLLAS